MKTWKRLVPFVVGMLLITMAANPIPRRAGENPNPPEEPVKLIFIHHSTGENWLTDGYGNLGQTLNQNNYFVSDTNYGWGPDGIGDNTDIPHWLDWFASADTSTYMSALFSESDRHSTYTRTLSDPGGQNEIIMFKSCFPNSALEGSPNDPPDPDGWLTVGHAKYVYNEILAYFATRPDKMFVVITAPPLRDTTYAANARAFNQWLMNDWLDNYNLNNVFVFDFYNVLTGPGAHHRYNSGQIEHILGSQNTLYYPSGDDHPSVAGSQKATNEFVPLLNIFYHRWKASMVGGCSFFPVNNIWNTPVDTLPVHASSSQWINSIGRNTGFHMDFGTVWEEQPIGIPYNVVGSGVPKVPVIFGYADESDPGPYPIPTNPLIEAGSDRHILIVDQSTCTLYELYNARYSSGQWRAGSGAIWDLNSNALRPDGWTSADAAGLPILPGLVRYDEVASGEINHAIRFTAEETAGYIWPARHLTSDAQNGTPPMGARFRLKEDYNISGFPPALQVILQAMKKYGIILADNGSDWYISGAPDSRWNDSTLHLLDVLTGDDFEAVDASSLMIDPDSAAASSQPAPAPVVTSIARADADHTSAATVDFTVTFSEPVTSIETTAPFDDFTLTTTGVSGAEITGIDGSGSTRTVTVSTGSGSGTIRLDVPGTATITNLAGDSLSRLPFTGGQVYAIEKGPIYDDVHANWTYNGFTATTTTGPYRGTMHYSRVVGSTAEIPIEGSQITLTYSKYSNRGTLAVYIDDSPDPVVTINQYNATRIWQASWTSGNLGAGEHMIRLVHTGGAQVDVDALEVKTYAPPPPQGVGKYDDANKAWTYNGFAATTTTGPYKGTMHYSKVVGSTAEFTFTGSQITLWYSKYSNRGTLAVYIDDSPDPVVTIDQYNATRIWQASWTSGNLGAGEHMIRLVHTGGAQVDV
ncbi:MAG TPA: hypothetical protein VKP08_01480, partial [Anaerolineales bacterium]|nr:hypothetical protein [Anaerolineales bacterium]